MNIDHATIAAEAERQGWAIEQGGGGTRILRKGRLILSGFDGDMPDDHWFMVALYRKPDDVEPLWSLADGTAEWPDCGPAVDIRAAIAAAERQALAYEFAETLRAYLTAAE